MANRRRKARARTRSRTKPPSAGPVRVRRSQAEISIEAAVGAVVTFTVTTTPLLVPFNLGLDGRTLMISALGGRVRTVLAPGLHVCSWFINHLEDGWSHELSFEQTGASQVLDKKAQASDDPALTVLSFDLPAA